MGVAAFYRWLTRKYPKVQTNVVEEKPVTVDGVVIPVDATNPNPNGMEFDNLYLDMNGVVHPCCHPQFKEAPKTEADMMVEVFRCLDRVFAMIRPRKLVYMALDGVAPRAKMNQQRSRRFRAAQEAEEKETEMAKLADEVFQATGVEQPVPEKPWDSNCITPGTPFMEMLAKSLRYYVATKLNGDPAWASVKVILSDSNVPGEGEHKIMDFIRRQRMMPGYNPNTSHVLYGLDADLIMLSLATHEPNFKILREDVEWAQKLSKPCRRCGKMGHFERDCGGRANPAPDVNTDSQPFVFANIDVLREYLEFALKPDSPLPFPFDLERAIDDWVFLCFFVGNDFLPHLPSLEIREGAIEKLVEFWKSDLQEAGGYITQCGEVDLFRVQPIVDKIAALEEQTFKDRKDEEEKRDRRDAINKARNSNSNGGVTDSSGLDEAANQMAVVAAVNARKRREEEEIAQKKKMKMAADEKNFAAASELKARLEARKVRVPTPTPVPFDGQDGDEEVMVSGTMAGADAGKKRPHERSGDESGDVAGAADANGHLADAAETNPAEDETDEHSAKRTKVEQTEEEEENEGGARKTPDGELSAATPDDNGSETSSAVDPSTDQVKFHEEGYKQRYYSLKFNISADDREEVHNIVEHYVRGLCWVLKYYYQGCASWDWYFPYHYAPLASDFVDLDMMSADFELGDPLRPFEQLMSVLPARSRHNLPDPFGPLMTEDESPIIDFYPTDFPLDLNGKKFLWQAVILLPFIDKQRLLDAVTKVYPRLLPEETNRNQRGNEILVVGQNNPLYESLCDIYTTAAATTTTETAEVPLNPKRSGRMSGCVSRDPTYTPTSSSTTTTYESPLKEVGMPDIAAVHHISVVYRNPQPDTAHMCVLLPGFQKRRHAWLNQADREFVRSGGNSGFRGPPRTTYYENNRDFGHFYGQRGNDVSRDRGYGPRRYDERGNSNPEYQRYYGSHRGNAGGGGGGNRYARPARPPQPPLNRPHPNAAANGYRGGSDAYGAVHPMPPPPPRPVGYRPFAGRPMPTPIASPTVSGGSGAAGYDSRHRSGGQGNHRRGGGGYRGSGGGGGYRGGHRGSSYRGGSHH
ncbi:5'-3' exoribonuclease 2 [Coemansia sp. Benny D160-2]|nr:5'-3' exoribonuclease 2 [Coemansia sp. Benny D160-2]